MMIAKVGGHNVRTVAGFFGCCRTFGPVRSAAKRGAADLLWDQSSLFSYSAVDVLQHVKLIIGDFSIPTGFEPVIHSRAGMEIIAPPRSLAHEVDVAFTEISSLTQVTASNCALNVNRLEVYMKGQSEAHAQWWIALKKGKPRHDIVDAIVLRSIAEGSPRPDWELEVLRTAELRRMMKSEVIAALSEISQRLSVPLVLGSHFQFSSRSEEHVPARTDLKDTLVEASQALGFKVFDPTEALLEFGRESALKREGADIAHYTDEFLPIVGSKILKAVMP